MNPYQPPASKIEPRGDASRHYSPAQIGVAAFIGGLIAGGAFMAANYRRVGQRDLARHWFLGSIALTVVMMAGLPFLDEWLPNRLLSNGVVPTVYSVGLWTVSRQLLATHWAAITGPDSRNESWWKVIALSILWFLVMMLIIGIATYGYLYITTGELPAWEDFAMEFDVGKSMEP